MKKIAEFIIAVIVLSLGVLSIFQSVNTVGDKIKWLFLTNGIILIFGALYAFVLFYRRNRNRAA